MLRVTYRAWRSRSRVVFLDNLVNLSKVYTETVWSVLPFHHNDGNSRRFDSSMTLLFNISSTSWLITACMAGFRGRYRCSIGWSIFSRMRCWSLSVGPITSSNFVSSRSRKSLKRHSSFGVWVDSPTESVSVVGTPVTRRLFGSGGLKVIPILAHKSTPINTEVFNEGIVRNSCNNFLVPILTWKYHRP